MKRTLAFFCKICPFCIAARKVPDSTYAKTLARLEKYCPACNAYKALYGDWNKPKKKEGNRSG